MPNIRTDVFFSAVKNMPVKTTPRAKLAPRTAKKQTDKRSSQQSKRQLSAKKSSQLIRKAEPKDSLRIYCLGGQEEVGRNCTVFECSDDIVIIDMGVQFPDEDMPGIDYIVPNIESLRGKEKNIRGVIFTHGHLDHIGAAPMLLEKLGNPLIIGRSLTLALVKNRQEDYRRGSSQNLKTLLVDYEDRITLGSFKARFFKVEHSVMDAMGVVLETPHGTVIHPGDWNLETDPASGEIISYEHLSNLPSPKILMLESLGAVNTKKRVSTRTALENIKKIIDSAKGRVIIGTFSSQIERISHIIEYAEKTGRKVALDGYSMRVNVEIAKQLGYIKAHQSTLIGVERIYDYPDNKIIVICTGAQGEPNASFSRIVSGSHRFIKIKKTDTIVFSSSIIPGNEATIEKLKNRLYHLTENVIHSEIMDVHASGHATVNDIKTVLKQIKPDFFLPVYAHYYMLVEAKKIGLKAGLKENQIFVLENGQIIEFVKGKPTLLKEKVNTDYVMVDGLGIGDLKEIVLRDRQHLAEDGIFVVIAIVDSKTGKVRTSPDIISRGFVYLKESQELLSEVRKKTRTIVEEFTVGAPHPINWMLIKENLREKIGQFLFNKTQRRPMVLPVVIEV